MNATDLLALLPYIVLAAFPTAMLLVISFHRHHGLIAGLAVGGLTVVLGTLPAAFSLAPYKVTPLFVIDQYALFYLGLVSLAALVIAVLSHGYLREREGDHEEFYVLLLLATLGATVLAASSHFVSLFLGLEILSVALYALIAYERRRERCLEAGVKYLVLAGVSAAFLLFGMALIYGELGTMEFSEIASRASTIDVRNLLLPAGVGMVVIGIGFKLGVVPFHLWTPDVYEGAPAPVTAFVATVSKGAMFALLLRYFSHFNFEVYNSLSLLFGAIAVASMFVGNLLALFQKNVKRILACSSIAHMGYLLVAFQGGGSIAAAAVTYYLVAYFVTTLGAFGIITVLSVGDREVELLDEYRGLAWQRPWIGAVFTLMLLSLAGMPLTAGFVAKYSVAAAAVGSALWLQVIALAASSAIGLFYYLRVIVALYTLPPGAVIQKRRGTLRLSPGDGLVLAVLTALLLILGVYPGPFIDIIQRTVSGMM